MDGRVRFGVALPQLHGVELLVRFARRAQQLGFARLWTLEAVVGSATSHARALDGVHALSFAAAVTERIGLGVAVIVLPADCRRYWRGSSRPWISSTADAWSPESGSATTTSG